MSSHRWCAVIVLSVLIASCGPAAAGDAIDSTPAVVVDTVLHSVRGTAPVAVLRASRPIAMDTSGRLTLELWPLAVSPDQQADETRRIVEHLHADLALVEGFESATLLANGDGSGLVLVAAWRDDLSADRGRAALTAWMYADVDSAALRRRLSGFTPRMVVRRSVGTPPMLGENAMLLLTRYSLKPGHSYGALATLADSNLAMRVLQDTSAQGGAMLVAADSTAICVLIQARTATALDLNVRGAGPLPFWAPFAQREEQLMAVVATVQHR